MVSATACIIILILGADICQGPGSLNLITITALPVCRVKNSPGWRASGGGKLGSLYQSDEIVSCYGKTTCNECLIYGKPASQRKAI